MRFPAGWPVGWKKRISDGGAGAQPNRTFLLATDFPNTEIRARYEALKDNPDWRMLTLACGYNVMIDKPRELADFRLQEVDR